MIKMIDTNIIKWQIEYFDVVAWYGACNNYKQPLYRIPSYQSKVSQQQQKIKEPQNANI